jgi:hypothetical protein
MHVLKLCNGNLHVVERERVPQIVNGVPLCSGSKVVMVRHMRTRDPRIYSGVKNYCGSSVRLCGTSTTVLQLQTSPSSFMAFSFALPRSSYISQKSIGHLYVVQRECFKGRRGHTYVTCSVSKWNPSPGMGALASSPCSISKRIPEPVMRECGTIGTTLRV